MLHKKELYADPEHPCKNILWTHSNATNSKNMNMSMTNPQNYIQYLQNWK